MNEMKTKRAPWQVGLTPVGLMLSLLCLSPNAVQAQAASEVQTKAIVIDQIQATARGGAMDQAKGDAMVVSLLEETPDGVLRPYLGPAEIAKDARFRVKVLSSRSGRVELFQSEEPNLGLLLPLLELQAIQGEEVISPRLNIDSHRNHYLQLVLRPSPRDGIFEGFNAMASSSYQTPGTAYVYNPRGEGLIVTLRIEKKI